MSAPDETHKAARDKLGELLRGASDHILLLTATLHKGDPVNFIWVNPPTLLGDS